MTVLDIQTAKEISELLKEGKSLDEIRKLVDQHGGTINAWIADALLSKDLGAPLSQLKDAIIARILKDTAIAEMLKAASEPSETKSYKTTILSQLSKSDETLLESKGYTAFIQQVEVNAIILKVEETCTSTAPDPSLFKEILKIIGDEDKGETQKLMPFNKTHPDLPEV